MPEAGVDGGPAADGPPRHVCLVYDCLYPWTIGGAERWYRSLAESLAAGGDRVTYLSLRQWPRDEPPSVPGVRVVAVGPRMPLYAGERRRIAPPLRFGLGVFWHLLRHGRRYDAVHTAAFPFFSLLAAALLRPLGRYALVVDWWEVWSVSYWRRYLGPVRGSIGWLVQYLCARMPQRALCYSRLHAERLRAAGVRSAPVLLRNVLPALPSPAAPVAAEPRVLFAGRLTADKGAADVVPAVAAARRDLPALRATIAGDGPERQRLVRLVDAFGLRPVVDLPGFVPRAELDALVRSALCLVLPSRREGYGLILLEAAAAGTPSIVVAHPDNAAAEWIVEGVNGFVVAAGSETELASAILRAHASGSSLRRSTARWFAGLAVEHRDGSTVEAIRARYRADLADWRGGCRRDRTATG